MTGYKHILWRIGLGCASLLAIATGVFADAQESPTPPGYAAPQAALPLPEPGPATRSSRLSFSGANRVIHEVDFDRSPRRWADGLLVVRVGHAAPWRPEDSYALFPLGLRGISDKAVTVLEGELIVFDKTPTGPPGEIIPSTLNPAYTLGQAEDGLVVTRANDRRWYFEPVHFGASWRLNRMELVRFPGQMTVLEHDDNGLTAIRYPNEESVAFEYENGLPSRIALPFDEEVQVTRDDRGFVTEIKHVRSSHANSERGVLRRFEYERIDQSRISRFTNERDIEFTVVYDEMDGDENTFTTSVHNPVDRSYAFRRCELTSQGRRKTIDGFGDYRTPVQDAIEVYTPWATDFVPASLPRHGGATASVQSGHPFAPSVLDTDRWLRGTYRVYVPSSSSRQRLATAQAPAQWVGFNSEVEYQLHFDTHGRVIQATAPDQETVSFLYDDRGNLIETRVGEESHQFITDEWGRIIQQIRSDGVETHWRFDDTGDLVALETRTPIQKDEDAAFAPDEFKTVVTAFERDRLGRIGQVSYSDDRADRFQFDPRGNMLAWSPADGGLQQRTRYGYDKLGRLARIDRPRDAEIQREEFDYHPGDAVASHKVVRRGERRNERAEYEYDLQGQLVAETIGGLGRTQYRYDNRGRRHHIIHPDGTETTYKFDDLNRIVTIRGSHQPPVDIAYDEMGQRTVTPATDANSSAATAPAPGNGAPGSGGTFGRQP